MRYLVDSNVLSEPTHPSPNPAVVGWLRTHERLLVVDAIILGELRLGVLALPLGRKRARIEGWFESIVNTIECIPWDRNVSLCWANMVIEQKKRGISLPLPDSMIAATALTHGLSVATRNVRHFDHSGLKVVNPFMIATD